LQAFSGWLNRLFLGTIIVYGYVSMKNKEVVPWRVRYLEEKIHVEGIGELITFSPAVLMKLESDFLDNQS